MSLLKDIQPGGAGGEKIKGYVYIIVIVVIIIIAIVIMSKVMGGFDQFLQWLGIEPSKDDQANAAKIKAARDNANSPTSPWNPTMWQAAPSGSSMISDQDALQAATDIYASVGIIYDTPGQGYAALQRATTQAQVSKISWMFQNSTIAQNLYDWLAEHYDTSNQKQVLSDMIDYVSKLPTY